MKYYIFLFFLILSWSSKSQISTYVRPCMSISTIEKEGNFFQVINNSIATLNFKNTLKRVNIIPIKKPIASDTIFSEYAKDITSYLFNKDSNNLFNVRKILEFSEYASSDVQSFISNNSADKDQILTQIATEMLGKVYILTIDLKKVETYKDYYDRKEAKRKARNERTRKLGGEVSESNQKPIERKLYGYLCDFGFKLRQVNWTPEMLNYFYTNCWIDENTPESERAKKIDNFSNLQLSSKVVWEELQLDVSVGKSKSKRNGRFIEPTQEQMNKILTSSLPLGIINQTNKSIVQNVPEFKIFNVLSSTYPCKSKIGTKEGIRNNDRYFAYEKIQKRDGETLLRRKGVLYVNSVVNNEKDNSLASNFLQRGGRSLYNGMMIYEELDKKINFDFNYNHSTAPLNLSSYSLSIGFGPFGKRSAAYVGLSIGASTFQDLNYVYNYGGNYDADTATRVTISPDGYSLLVGLEFARAIYLTKRGNLFLYPNFSVNAGFLSFSNKDGEDQDFEDEEYEPSPVIVDTRFGIGLGFHIVPSVSIFYKPSIGVNIAAWESNANDDDDESESEFRTISEMGEDIKRSRFNFINTISLRIHI